MLHGSMHGSIPAAERADRPRELQVGNLWRKLLHIIQLEKTRCDKITVQRDPKGEREIGELVKKPAAIWKAGRGRHL